MLKTDCIFTRHSKIDNIECCCRLRIFQVSFAQNIVIVSELFDNPDRSISDEALTLISLICDRFQLSLSQTMWLEHHPNGYLKDGEVYKQVLSSGNRIHSYRISKKALESLLSFNL